MTIRIRLATKSDAEGIHAIYSPFVLNTSVSFEFVPPTLVEMENRITNTLKMYPWIVLEKCDGVNDTIIGYAYACRHNPREAYQWTVETSVYLAPEAQFQGLGKKLYRVLCDLLIHQGFYTAIGGVVLPNEASLKLHQSMGYIPVTKYKNIGYKLGKWWDTIWLQKQLKPIENNPTPPIPIKQLSNEIVNSILSLYTE